MQICTSSTHKDIFNKICAEDIYNKRNYAVNTHVIILQFNRLKTGN